MSKYIEAEKVIAEIQKLRSESCISESDDYYEYAKSEIIDIITSLQQEQPVTKEPISHLEHWLAFFGCPEENIEKCATQIAQGYGAIRYLEGVQHGAEAVNELAQQEQPEFVKEIWHKVSEEANLTRPVVLSDGDKYMSPPCTFPFKDMSGFVEAMNKKYKADYTIWAYMDDLLNISSLQQEQPEVEFEEEIDVFFYGKNFKRCNDGVRVPGALMRDWQNQNVSRSLSTDEIRRFAHHFYELGLNARKEE